jgi:hypothetical protein
LKECHWSAERAKSELFVPNRRASCEATVFANL